MPFDAKTKIHDLLEAHPFLLDFLAEYHSEFQKLRNPVLRSTLARVASIEMAAGLANVPVGTLLADLEAEVARHEDGGRVAPPTQAEPREIRGETSAVGEARRQEILKGIINDLHAGTPLDDIKRRFTELIQEVSPGEIAAMEQALIAGGMPVEEIQALCDVHVSVFRESLDTHDEIEAPVGHPVHTFMAENRVLADIIASLRCSLEELAAASAGTGSLMVAGLRPEFDRLGELDIHYLRKENQLFPTLERHGITGPTRVMWAVHDDIRAVFKEVRAAMDAGDPEQSRLLLDQLLTLIEDMVYKEEKILYPVSLEALSVPEWEEIKAGEGAIGYAWGQAPPDLGEEPWDAAAAAAVLQAEQAATAEGRMLLPLTTGALDPVQVDLLLRSLPFDLTFVDENDEVRYYSEGERVFPRSPAVIGRRVQNCHPPKSVHIVQRVVDEFRSGTKDTADFWIQREGRFILIRYFAMRDGEGAYRGTIEVVQEATWVRGLEGERRLLDW